MAEDATKTRGKRASQIRTNGYQWLLLGIIFLLPLQTRLILDPGWIGGVASEYTTWSLYFIECLIALAILISPFERFTKNRRVVFLLIFLLWAACSLTFSSIQGSTGLFHLLFAGSLGILLFFSRLRMRSIARAFVASGVLQAIVAIMQFSMQRVIASKWLGVAEQLPQTLGVSIIERGTHERVLRAYGLLPHPNIAAGFLIIALIMGIGLLLYQRKRAEKWLLLSSLIVISTGLFFTFSRSAWIALFLSCLTIAIGIFGWRRKKWKRLVVSLACIYLPLLILFGGFTELVLTRVVPDTGLETKSVAERQQSVQDGWTIAEHAFPLGVGYGNTPLALAELFPERDPFTFQPIHNIYLLILGELSVIGLGSFLAVVISALWGIRLIRSWSLISSAAFVALLTIGWFDHYLFSLASGLLLFFSVWGVTNKKPPKSSLKTVSSHPGSD